MDSVICSRRILVSDLPQMDPESLVDKLGFHFSKKANGGGDVEACQMMEDTWTAVITFTEDDSETAPSRCCPGLLPPPLTTCVPLSNSRRCFGAQAVPRCSGAEDIAQSQSDALHQRTDEQPQGDGRSFLLHAHGGGSHAWRSSLQVQTQVCSRTVLLTGIPDVLDPETLQDFLEVHFQKGSSGGGEVLHCLYNPLGRRTQAVFSGRSKV